MDMNRREPREQTPETARNSSSGIRRRPRGFLHSDAVRLGRSGLLAWVLLAAGVGAGVLMIVAELSTVSYVTVVTATCEDLADPRLTDRCLQKGHERHGYAFLLLGGFSILMAWGATVGRSRPAAAALALTGAVVLGIGFARDYGEGGKAGLIGEAYEATAHRGNGLWLELAGGALALVVGMAALVLLRRPGVEAAPPPDPGAREEPARA
jgi:hypothetical protein